MRSEIDLETMLFSWPQAQGMARKHLARQLREEILHYLHYGQPLPQVLADWLATALDEKDIDLFADPWDEFVPTAEYRRRLKMAIMTRIIKNRPDLWQEAHPSDRGLFETVADLFSGTVRAVQEAYDEHREMLDFFEQRMGLTHLPTKRDILTYRDAGLERIAEALEETIRSQNQLMDQIFNCLRPDTDAGKNAT